MTWQFWRFTFPRPFGRSGRMWSNSGKSACGEKEMRSIRLKTRSLWCCCWWKCFYNDTVGWVAGRATGLWKKTVTVFHSVAFSEQVELENKGQQVDSFAPVKLLLNFVFGCCLWSPYVIGQTIVFSSCLWSPYVIGQTIIFSSCSFFPSSFFFFSSPNLSGRRSDVYHTSTHGVALARI